MHAKTPTKLQTLMIGEGADPAVFPRTEEITAIRLEGDDHLLTAERSASLPPEMSGVP